MADVIDAFSKLPGIGPKTAQRLAYYLLHVPQTELDSFANSLANLRKNTLLCSTCKNVALADPCEFCGSPSRDKSTVLVVEQPLDILAFERTNKYQGVYHVLHGAINPLDNIGPDEIFTEELVKRVKGTNGHTINEVIIATNPTMEGEATAMYLAKQLKNQNSKLKISRLGMGIPTGAYLEFADEMTIRESLEGRREL